MLTLGPKSTNMSSVGNSPVQLVSNVALLLVCNSPVGFANWHYVYLLKWLFFKNTFTSNNSLQFTVYSFLDNTSPGKLTFSPTSKSVLIRSCVGVKLSGARHPLISQFVSGVWPTPCLLFRCREDEIRLNVLDTNDDAPVFVGPRETLVVREDASVGVVVGRYQAEDNDAAYPPVFALQVRVTASLQGISDRHDTCY